MIRLAVFLGNPGPEYAHNRHNTGRLLADHLPFAGELSWRKKFKGLFAQYGEALLLEPETYMNSSGDSIAEAVSFYKIAPEEVIVVHDELELFPGTLSLKLGGGLGGHNGLRSTKAALGTDAFWRLRVGIGRPPGRLPGEGGPPGSGGDVYGWVLSDFGGNDMEAMERAFQAGAALIVGLFSEKDPTSLLPEWRKKVISAQ